MQLRFPENSPKEFRFATGANGATSAEVNLDHHADFSNRGDGQFVHFSKFNFNGETLGFFSLIDTRPRPYANKVSARINEMAALDFFFIGTATSVLDPNGNPRAVPNVNVAFNVDPTLAKIASSVILDLNAALELYVALKAKFEPRA